MILQTGSQANYAAQRRIAQLPLTALLIVAISLPTFLFYFSIGTSLASGSAVVALIVMAVGLSTPNRLQPLLRRSVSMISLIAFVISVHLAIAGLLHTIDVAHAVGSILPLAVIILGGTVLAGAAVTMSDKQLDQGVRAVIWLMCLFAFVKVVGLRVPASREFSNPVFPFTEPSHFALQFLPFYMYMCVSLTATRRLAMLALGLILALVLESLTLAIGWLLIVLVCSRGWLIPAGIALLSTVVLTQIDLTYFLDRLNFSSESNNISTLVYLQGWELMWEGLSTTHGWGLGFQQLGLQGTNSAISRIIYVLLGSDSNILDGGFVFAKLVSEFGVIGIGLGSTMMFVSLQALLQLRKTARKLVAGERVWLLMNAVLASYLVELLVRGIGYFSASVMLVVAALWLRQFLKNAAKLSDAGAIAAS